MLKFIVYFVSYLKNESVNWCYFRVFNKKIPRKSKVPKTPKELKQDRIKASAVEISLDDFDNED